MPDIAGVLLHGRGGTPDDMLEILSRLSLSGGRWATPGAPGGQWYPHRFMGPVEANEPFLSAAVAICDDALHETSAAGRIGPDRSVVLGFSQGACLASEYVLRHPRRCRALIMFTGGLIGPAGTEWRPAGPRSATLTGLRVLITGSDTDQWVPEERVRLTARVLEDLGATVALHIYPGRPHLVSDDEIGQARTLLNTLGGVS